jgi:two-component system cell cycle sensor histidine kinase/response regulator CckA
MFFGELRYINYTIGSMMKRNNELDSQTTDDNLQDHDFEILSCCVAHDINNLLTVIQGNLSLLLLDCPEANQSFSGRLKKIESCVQSSHELTNEIFSYSMNKKEYLKRINLNTIIAKIIDCYGSVIKGIAIDTKLESNILITKVNPSQIERAILNLLINAYKAMPNGGNLTISTENILTTTVMPVNAQPNQEYVKISISDTGFGLNPEIQNHMFKPFFSTRLDQSGFGLGLASVKRIIDNHNGLINTKSEKDQGTTFEIFIPALSPSIEMKKITD